ncbi:hypothetical protein [Cohnella kolymensis]|nr:hypothetical protein [Cohnella kolymensis]
MRTAPVGIVDSGLTSIAAQPGVNRMKRKLNIVVPDRNSLDPA